MTSTVLAANLRTWKGLGDRMKFEMSQSDDQPTPFRLEQSYERQSGDITDHQFLYERGGAGVSSSAEPALGERCGDCGVALARHRLLKLVTNLEFHRY